LFEKKRESKWNNRENNDNGCVPKHPAQHPEQKNTTLNANKADEYGFLNI
jgi:hypothetical protein